MASLDQDAAPTVSAQEAEADVMAVDSSHALGDEAQAQQHDTEETQQNHMSDQDEATIVRIEQLLRVKDDTSRFVALALLKAVLDNQPETSAPSLLRLWDALPVKFLDKLLRAGLNAPSTHFITASSASSAPSSARNGGAEAAHMRDLAVAVLHTFAVRILPQDRRGDVRLTGRIPLLVASLLNATANTTTSTAGESTTATDPSSSSTRPESVTTLILQTLATVVSSQDGAAVFYKYVDDYSPLIELAPMQPLVLDILLSVWLYGFLAGVGRGVGDGNVDHSITQTLQTTMPKLVAAFKGTDGVTLLDFVARLLRNAVFIVASSNQPEASELLPTASASMVWLRPVAGFIRRLAINRPTARSRAAYTYASAALVHTFQGAAEVLLFGEDQFPSTGSNIPLEDKSFAYLFVNLLLVDLRATLPGLLAKINDKESYISAASRLSAAYDILTAFIGYLMRSMDDDNDDEEEEEGDAGMRLGTNGAPKLTLSADNLLHLRTSMSEAMSVTVEYLRDRWDAAVAGAQGLHPDARSGLGDRGSPQFSHALDAAGLPLTWDAADADMVASRDPLVLAAVRTLALWLREDDNTTLRREALGLADMLMELYTSSAEPGSQDIRLPVLDAIEGITYLDLDGDREDGRDDSDRKAIPVLMEHNVWNILTSDLVAILQNSGKSETAKAGTAGIDARRGIEIASVLLPIVATGSYGAPPDAWMDFVTLVAAWSGPDDDDEHAADENDKVIVARCRVAALRLATELVRDLRPAIYRQYVHSISAIRGLASRVRRTLKPPVEPHLKEDLDEIITSLGRSQRAGI